MQANAKVKEGSARHPDRDAQFGTYQGRPGNTGGRGAGDERGREEEGAGRGVRPGRAGMGPQGSPVRARDHSSPVPRRARDPLRGLRRRRECGFVDVGTAPRPPRWRWSRSAAGGRWPAGTPTRPARLLVTCDAGGSNGWRNRAWKAGLAELARRRAWRSPRATSRPAPPSGTRSSTGCSPRSPRPRRPAADRRRHHQHHQRRHHQHRPHRHRHPGHQPPPRRASRSDNEEMRDLEERCLTRHAFHGEWNYTFLPAPRPAPEPAPAPGRPARTATWTPSPTPRSPACTRAAFDDLAASARSCRYAAAPRAAPAPGPRRPPPAPGARPGRHRSSSSLHRPTCSPPVCRYRLGLTCQAIAALLRRRPLHHQPRHQPETAGLLRPASGTARQPRRPASASAPWPPARPRRPPRPHHPRARHSRTPRADATVTTPDTPHNSPKFGMITYMV